METCTTIPEKKYAVNLQSWLVVKISGKDRFKYLDNIVSFDLEKIEGDQYFPNMLLTPKGKIRSLFWITDRNDAYILLCPNAMKQNLIEDLLKYNINVEVKLEDITNETEPLWYIVGETTNVMNSEILLPIGKFSFDESVHGTAIDDVVFKKTFPPQKMIWMEYLVGHNPVEVGLKNIISLEKGCFLGQEPIARMVNRGRPRFNLFQVHLINEDFQIDENQNLLWKDKTIGQVLQACIAEMPVAISLLKVRGEEEEVIKQLMDQKLAFRLGTY